MDNGIKSVMKKLLKLLCKNKITNQKINYYFNTRFEPTSNLSKELIDRIKQTDALVLIGYAPHYSLIKYLGIHL